MTMTEFFQRACLCLATATLATSTQAGDSPTDGPAEISWTGHADANNQLQILPADIVQQWLPSGLELAPVPGYPAGMHPVVFVFQRQSNAVFNGQEQVPDYLEQAVIVPWARLAGQQKVRNFMPKLYLNSARAVEIGAQSWAMPKVLATLGTGAAVDMEQWAVRAMLGGRLVSAEFSPVGSLMDVNSFVAVHPSFMNELPLFGIDYVGMSLNGPVCYEIVYDLTQAQFQAMSGTVHIHSRLLPGLPKGSTQTLGINPQPAQDSFRVVGPYVIAAAHSCQE